MTDEKKEMRRHMEYFPQFVRNNVPFISKSTVAASLLLGSGQLMYSLGTHYFYSPGLTNSINLFTSLLCHVGIVIGPASIYAMRLLNYSVYPRDYRPLMEEMKTIRSNFSSFTTKPGMITWVPLALMFAAMTL